MGKYKDKAFLDPGLNDFDVFDSIDSEDDIKKVVESDMSKTDRLILLTLCGIGARVDRLIKMVGNLEGK